ncbi:hypothetical protein RIF29_08941 [Crotalaria pallida]|uniref:Uncharacterized protein n=1 Tax=Crotalaria pallida TaxID=3830 RepID=A0AAN9ILL0_CROPI
MLARKPVRVKGKQISKQERDSALVKEHESRFNSLSTETDSVPTDLPHTNDSEDQSQGYSLVRKQALAGKRPIRVRNALGGKNPQTKIKQTTKGPNIPANKENNTKPSMELPDPKSQHSAAVEQTRTNKDKELLILHKMRNIVRQGHNGIDNFTTHVVLPNAEMVDFDLLQRGQNTVLNLVPKPPDPATVVEGSPVLDSGNDGAISMVIDSASTSSLQPNSQKDGLHPVKSSHERLPSNITQ